MEQSSTVRALGVVFEGGGGKSIIGRFRTLRLSRRPKGLEISIRARSAVVKEIECARLSGFCIAETFGDLRQVELSNRKNA